jgi:ubiquinone/menaquinone biosynthesis C-methylase UbiE
MCCSICGSLSLREYLPSDAGHVMRCERCGFIFLSMDLCAEELRRMYSQGYFLERREYFFCDGVIDDNGIESPHVKDFREGLTWIERYKRPPGRLLDIGCATGSFLKLVQERRWDCYGVEVSDYAASIARDRLGVEIYNGSFEDAPFPSDFFDVLTMWDIIEHFPKPLEALKTANRVLKPEGILLVNTPNEASLLRKMAKFIYHGSGGVIRYPVTKLYHCYHLAYFNAGSLNTLFEKAGFGVVTRRKKIMPITRGRSSPTVKIIRKIISSLEKLCHGEYELFFIAQKPN